VKLVVVVVVVVVHPFGVLRNLLLRKLDSKKAMI